MQQNVIIIILIIIIIIIISQMAVSTGGKFLPLRLIFWCQLVTKQCIFKDIFQRK